MAKITAKLKCPGCDIRNDATFKRPGILGDVTNVTIECEGCRSIVAFVITRPSTRTNELSIRSGIKVMSDLLIQMMKEEAEHRMKPVEDQ